MLASNTLTLPGRVFAVTHLLRDYTQGLLRRRAADILRRCGGRHDQPGSGPGPYIRLQPHRRVLGLGAGVRAFLVAIRNEWPELAATVLELPAIVPLRSGRGDIDSDGTRDVDVMTDFFAAPIPADHDAVIVPNVVHRMSPKRNRMTPGARLLLIDVFTDRTRTQPLAGAPLAGESSSVRVRVTSTASAS